MKDTTEMNREYKCDADYAYCESHGRCTLRECKSYPVQDKTGMNEKLKNDIIEILEYFNDGLSDIESGSGEKQPMHKEIKSALKRLNKVKEGKG